MKTAEAIIIKHTGARYWESWDLWKKEAVIKAMEEYRLQSHPSPMSAEQVGYTVDDMAKLWQHVVDGAKEIMLGIPTNIGTFDDYIASTIPSVKADGWVSVEEKQRLEQIIELKEKERQEWANMCIKKEKILEGLISGYCTVNEYMYDEYGKLILKEISETFLKNATKADRLSDTEVFQALGETILNFPLPAPPKQQL